MVEVSLDQSHIPNQASKQQVSSFYIVYKYFYRNIQGSTGTNVSERKTLKGLEPFRKMVVFWWLVGPAFFRSDVMRKNDTKLYDVMWLVAR